MRLPHSALLSLAIGALSLSMQLPAHAQSYLSPNPPRTAVDDRFRLEVDLMYGFYDTGIRLDEVITVGGVTNVNSGTAVLLEDDFGFPKAQLMGQVELTLLPGDHHLVRFNGLSMRRNGSQTLTRNVAWDNDDYLAGERVDSHLDLTLVGLTYGYLPFRAEKYELGVTFGVQILSVNANAEVRSRMIRESDSAAGPLPMVGLEGRLDLTRRWSADGRVQYFSLGMVDLLADVGDAVGIDVQSVRDEIANKSATVLEGRVALRWRQNQHLIYGLGYRFFDINVDSPDSDPAGAFIMNVTGPMLFVQASL